MKYIYNVCYLLFVITEPEPRLEDLTGVELYVALCERIGIVPLSCVKNNIHKTHFHMPHRGIGAKGVQALAPPIAVSIQRAYLAKINKVLILCLSSGVR